MTATPQPSLTSHPQELTAENVESVRLWLHQKFRTDDTYQSFSDIHLCNRLCDLALSALSLTAQLAQEKARVVAKDKLLEQIYRALVREGVNFTLGTSTVEDAPVDLLSLDNVRATAAERQLAAARKDALEEGAMALAQRNKWMELANATVNFLDYLKPHMLPAAQKMVDDMRKTLSEASALPPAAAVEGGEGNG